MLSETQIKSMLDEKNTEYEEVVDFMFEDRAEPKTNQYQAMQRHRDRLISEIALLETILEINE